MPTRIITLLIVLSFALFSATPAFAWGEVKKAKEFMAAGMYPQAIELLDKRVNDKPTDAEAHYQLGICYINTGKYSRADERFASAVRIKPDYGYKIGGEYKKAGTENLNKGQISQAKTLFNQAIKYQPNLKQNIVKEAFSQGKNLFDQSQYNAADNRFKVALTFDASLSKQVCDMYFELGQKAGEAECVVFYRRVKSYCSNHNKTIGERMLAIAKSKKSESEIQKWRKAASNFIKVPPDYIVINEKFYRIQLLSGKAQDKFIRTSTADFLIRWNSENEHFYLKTRSGRKITLKDLREGEVYFGEDFKVIPTKKGELNIMIEFKE